MKAIIPISADKLDGPYKTLNSECFNVLADHDKVVLIELFDLPEEIDWVDEFVLMYCQRQHDPDIIKVIRQATAEDRRLFRVPLWIQDEEIPECCGRPMFFVGQIDDEKLWSEGPKDAKYWWHDIASFYVFTCSQCLGCKSVGQQY